MNRGKFQQIIDNLIFNAEYWVGQQIADLRPLRSRHEPA